MKQSILILLISLLLPTLSFSQTTYPKITKDSLIVLTPLQLKKTNIIFVEHSQMKLEIPLLEDLINTYEESIENLVVQNNLKKKQISTLNNSNKEYKEALKSYQIKFKKEQKKSKILKGVTIGSCSVSLAILLTLLLAK